MKLPGYPTIPVPYSKNRIPIADKRASAFYLRFTQAGKRKSLPAGKNVFKADDQKKALEAKMFGGASTEDPAPAKVARLTIADAVSIYFRNLEAQGKSRKSIQTYRFAVDQFVTSCRKEFVDEVDRQDLFDFLRWLRNRPAKPRKHANPERTLFNKVNLWYAKIPSNSHLTDMLALVCSALRGLGNPRSQPGWQKILPSRTVRVPS